MNTNVTRDGFPSVAGMQIAHDTRDVDTAPVTLVDAIAWGENNRMKATGNAAKDVAAINRMRGLLKLPPFSIIPDRGVNKDNPLPPPTFGGNEVLAPVIAKIEPIRVKEASLPMARPEESSHVATTSKRLRDILFQELTDLRAGKSTPQQAAAVAKIAHQIIAGVRMEMDFAREFPPTIEGNATKLLAG